MVIAMVTMANERCEKGQKKMMISGIEHDIQNLYTWTWQDFQKTEWYQKHKVF